ncbi:MAG TPA: iron-containing redox enzyme family protein [Solirubrobacteraceae bacterium]|jgi:pyrroloquinoline-quinone synthase|nr:iron-containing redox enzyme family protein [Solirubrobacteraceae bacterium]
MNLWDRFAAVRAEWDVLGHPFYERWSRGELTPGELATYSGQYRHAVVALADASAGAAERATGELRSHLEVHAAEEAGHVALWDQFVEAASGDCRAAALPETADCAAAWADPTRGVGPTLSALYSIESAQPDIAAIKRRGLLELYGFEAGEATEYFDVHAELDHEHAAAHRAWIEERLAGEDEDELVQAARRVLAANWTLLDGVSADRVPPVRA